MAHFGLISRVPFFRHLFFFEFGFFFIGLFSLLIWRLFAISSRCRAKTQALSEFVLKKRHKNG